VTSHTKSTKRSLRNYMSLSTSSAYGAVISTSLPAYTAHVSSNWPNRVEFCFGAVVSAIPRIVEGNESYILGEIGFIIPGINKRCCPLICFINHFNNSCFCLEFSGNTPFSMGPPSVFCRISTGNRFVSNAARGAGTMPSLLWKQILHTF
jgi:hypothetical protein